MCGPMPRDAPVTIAVVSLSWNFAIAHSLFSRYGRLLA
jgi:hypothetical protein